MTRLFTSSAGKRRRALSAFGFVLAAFALWIRLAVPMPLNAPASDDVASAAFLAEHALCLSDASPGTVPPSQQPAHPADHADHHDCVCCPWHAGAGLVVVRDMPIGSVAFIEIAVAETPTVPLQPRLLRSGPLGARAPPRPRDASLT